MELPRIEPYKIKMVEPVLFSSREDRERWIREADYNLFNLRSEQVLIDVLTDSGTGAMSQKQWAEIMLGDESYAGAASYYKLKNAISELLGFPFFLPTHQGRAAENVLFQTLLGHDAPDQVIPGNSHFDTTKGHIEFRHARPLDITIDEAFDTTLEHPFKGNLNLDKLEAALREYGPARIPLVLVTITCNSSGGQPVSMANLRAVSELCKKHGVRLFFDAARFAENAYFIKVREPGFADRTIREIVREMFSYADGFTMSAKKDGIVNIGGLLAFRDEDLFKRCCTFNIIYEGYITYGGLAGRDLGALSQGLYESTEFDYLQARVGQVEYLGRRLREFGIPVQWPIGGHAVFVDAKKFFPHIPQDEFPAQLLGVELYLEAGVRAVEIGMLLADRDPVTRQERYPALELLRLAIPRRVYNQQHMEYMAVALKNLWDRRESITRGFAIVSEAPIMRHFTVRLRRL
ncbi:MAG: tyrosine phenol-lyase [Deltaproteobacteria bacterium HGW-Deltaproteobacteria-17]|nr:MAG: tyrosine phenol-lyase [Deltaproteobacteria bacterium HGW-Deltaproteobacteria-17]